MGSGQVFVFLAAIMLSAVEGQNQAEVCCNGKIMDTTGEVFLEAKSEPIEEGWYDQVRVRVCATDETYIMLWEPANVDNPGIPGVNTTWRLIWLMEVPKPMRSQEMIVVNLTERIYIKGTYRMGVWAIANENSEGKIAVPYTFNARFPKIYRSLFRFDDKQRMVAGLLAQFDALIWPRVFYVEHVLFCDSVRRTCAESPNTRIILEQGPRGPQGIPGPPGEQGPPGPPGTLVGLDTANPTNGPFGFSCDSPDTLHNLMQEVRDKSRDIETELNDLKASLGAAPNLRTGACPSGWAHGPYGNGYCYKVFDDAVSFAEASMRCLTDDDHVNGGGALLTSIDNQPEDDFLTSLVLQTVDPDLREANGEWSLWTAGMYNVQEKIWLWYYQRAWQYKRGGLESPQVGYTNWAPGEPPAAPGAKREICLLLRVRSTPQRGEKESQWISADCRAPNYFVCKAPKQCF